MQITTWLDRVVAYLDELETVAATLQRMIADTRLQTKAGSAKEVEASSAELLAALTRLESRVEERERLLSADDAPPTGTTLIEKLDSLDEVGLVKRSRSIAAVIASTHNAAVSLFVCHYHLANYSQEVLRFLSGIDTPSTYGRSSEGDAKQRGGGRLFNDAA